MQFANDLLGRIKLGFSEGEYSQLDFNKADLSYKKSKNKYVLNRNKINTTLAELSRIAGINIQFTSGLDYPVNEPDNTNTTSYLEKLIVAQKDINNNEISIATAKNYPKIEPGFKHESILNKQLNGISLGISMPLFKSSSKIESRQVLAGYYSEIQEAQRLKFQSKVESLKKEIASLKQLLESYSNNITESTQLLNQSFEIGNINLNEYSYELKQIYEFEDEFFNTKYLYKAKILELEMVKFSM